MKISIIGTGYVGLVTGVCLAEKGHEIMCVDYDKSKIEKINKSISPIFEKDLENLLKKNIDKIKATDSYDLAIKKSDMTFICVGTPSNKNGKINLSYLESSIKEIAKLLKEKKSWHLIIIKSTVVPGTTRDFVIPLLEKHSEKKSGTNFGVCMNPEFLREGVAVSDFLKPDRIVIGGIDKKSIDFLKKAYESFNCPIFETSLSAAEMIKYASNCFLATKISFINEIGNFCKELNIDSYEVAEGMGLDKRIERSFLNSGIGWGGSCFLKDVDALISWSKEKNLDSLILESVKKVNINQPLVLVDLLEKHIPKLKNKTIGILGLSFKPDTDDIRDSRAIPIVKKLIKKGAKVKAYDPESIDNFKKIFPNIIYCKSAQDVLNSDAVLITTIWDEFKNLDFTGKIVIDGRRLEKAKNAKIYEGICW